MQLKIRATFARRSSHKSDPNDFLQLEWILRNTPIALKYFKALQIAEKSRYMYRRDRFYSFPNCYYTEEKIVEKLNQCIERINQQHPGLIPVKAEKGMSQDEMNHLHTYFEKHRGPLLNPAEIYANASVDIREAFDELNLMIHRYEDEGFSGRALGIQLPKFYFTFGLSELIRRYPLGDEDYKQFTFERQFGTWIINYCEVGKPLHDVLRDGDAEIGHEAIIPLRYYSADGVIFLTSPVSQEQSDQEVEKFHRWWDQNNEKIEALGFHKGDPKNSLGHLPVADLNRKHPLIENLNDQQIVQLLSHYQWTHHVECLKEV